MTMQVQSAISATHLTKSYGKGDSAFLALDDINLSIATGESIAIVGKSGSGKSTLMHALALLERPSSGAILVGGEDASHMKPKQLYSLRNERFGFVFQQFFLNGTDTVLNNVILPLKIASVGLHERKERGMKALRSVEIEAEAGKKTADLSGGQKQRVCIARALINNPSIIFADEPTGNLDSHTGKNVEDLLFGLNSRQGITLVIVTHDQDIAARCDRQIHIKDGKLTSRSAI
jgi:putative ABC transport system ATP-binding protein